MPSNFKLSIIFSLTLLALFLKPCTVMAEQYNLLIDCKNSITNLYKGPFTPQAVNNYENGTSTPVPTPSDSVTNGMFTTIFHPSDIVNVFLINDDPIHYTYTVAQSSQNIQLVTHVVGLGDVNLELTPAPTVPVTTNSPASLTTVSDTMLIKGIQDFITQQSGKSVTLQGKLANPKRFLKTELESVKKNAHDKENADPELMPAPTSTVTDTQEKFDFIQHQNGKPVSVSGKPVTLKGTLANSRLIDQALSASLPEDTYNEMVTEFNSLQFETAKIIETDFDDPSEIESANTPGSRNRQKLSQAVSNLINQKNKFLNIAEENCGNGSLLDSNQTSQIENLVSSGTPIFQLINQWNDLLTHQPLQYRMDNPSARYSFLVTRTRTIYQVTSTGGQSNQGSNAVQASPQSQAASLISSSGVTTNIQLQISMPASKPATVNSSPNPGTSGTGSTPVSVSVNSVSISGMPSVNQQVTNFFFEDHALSNFNVSMGLSYLYLPYNRTVTIQNTSNSSSVTQYTVVPGTDNSNIFLPTILLGWFPVPMDDFNNNAFTVDIGAVLGATINTNQTPNLLLGLDLELCNYVNISAGFATYQATYPVQPYGFGYNVPTYSNGSAISTTVPVVTKTEIGNFVSLDLNPALISDFFGLSGPSIK